MQIPWSAIISLSSLTLIVENTKRGVECTGDRGREVVIQFFATSMGVISKA